MSLENSEAGPALVVSDTGPGIPPEDRARVTDRFVRLERSRHSPGTGLGLSLVAAVARLHEAQLLFEDNNPGLRVKVLFKPTASVSLTTNGLSFTASSADAEAAVAGVSAA